jgi:superfamily II helicase
MEQFGTSKREQRIEMLARLGLVKSMGKTVKITGAGRACAFGLRLLVVLAHLTDLG